MFVPAPYETHHSGLQEVFSAFNQAISWIGQINKDTAAITDPTVSDADKAAAYLDFAALSKTISAESKTGGPILTDINTKLQTYLQSLIILPQHWMSDGLDTPYLQYQGRNATVWDIVTAINNKDTSHDFTVWYPPRETNSWVYNSNGACDSRIDIDLDVLIYVSTDVTNMMSEFLSGSTAVSTNSAALPDLVSSIQSLER